MTIFWIILMGLSVYLAIKHATTLKRTVEQKGSKLSMGVSILGFAVTYYIFGLSIAALVLSMM